jgi:hypothetical protein
MPAGRLRRAMLATGIVLVAAGGSAAASQAATIAPVTNSNAGALTLAQSMFQNPALITGASFVAHPPSGTPNAVVDGNLSFFPQNGSTFGLITSGDANFADDPNNSGSTTGDDAGPLVHGDTSEDVTILKIDFTAPANTNCLSVGSFAFYSEEYPEWVGSAYNDAFIAELDTNDWSTSGSTISAPHNFAFDPQGHVISINSTGATSMSAGNAAGTTYDGATQLLQAATQVSPGTHSLYLSIFDQGDRNYDSATMIDNIVIGTVPNPGEACQPGAQEQNYNMTLTPASDTNPVGSNHTVTATLSDANSGDPINGKNVKFTVTGANPGTGTSATNSSGQATYTWTGANAGDDTIVACADTDGDGNYCEAGEPTASATKHWEGPSSGNIGRMVSNGKRSGATFASNVDCDAAVATGRARPFQIQWSNGGTKTFKATSYSAVNCFDDPSFTPSPSPATTAFDTQTGTAAGTLNGAPGYTLEWRLEDHGAPNPADAARLKVTRNSDGAVVLDVPLGALSSGQNYALPPV